MCEEDKKKENVCVYLLNVKASTWGGCGGDSLCAYVSINVMERLLGRGTGSCKVVGMRF